MVLTLINSPQYNLTAEFLWFGVILHSNVNVPWTKGVRSRFKADLQTALRSLPQPVYAFQTPSHDPMKRRFILSVGGVFDHHRYTEDGERAEMFRFRALD